jgi:hypothetical protein
MGSRAPPLEHGQLLSESEDFQAKVVTGMKESAQVREKYEGKLDHGWLGNITP